MSTKEDRYSLNFQVVKNMNVKLKYTAGIGLMTAVLVGSLVLSNIDNPGGPEVSHPGGSVLAHIKLISLKCVKTEDWMGRDETYLTVNGARVWHHNMNDGETQFLGGVPNFPFAGEVRVALYDGDAGWGDDDDLLGVIVASARDVEEGPIVGSFTGDGAEYILTYEIVP